MLKPGNVLDNRYLITGDLGQGGMSYVFKAKDQNLERDVALKILRPHLTDTDQERFRREIKTLARLNHPGIVTIYDLGSGPQVYFTMELVEGGLFTDLGPLELDLEPLRQLLEAAITVAETLAYVHKLGIVHRDLTPRNILLNSSGHPKIMDFGLVQLAESTRELTRTGHTLGTPQYMAPEQARGEATSKYTDLYAFGVVLYKTVTGVNPFEADNDQAILYQHVYGELPAIQDYNPYVPDALCQLITALLAKNHQDRPSSGAIVAEYLRSILQLCAQQSNLQRLAGPAQQGVYPTGMVQVTELKRIWSITVPEGPQWPATLTAGQGFVFAGLRSEEILVIHPADGSVFARFSCPDEVNTAPLLHQDTLFASSRDGSLLAFDWPTGDLRWQDEKAGAVGILAHGQSLLVSTRHKTIDKRSLNSDIIWQYPTESASACPPIVHQGHLCCVTHDGWVHCLDANSGKGRFKIELGTVAATPAAKAGILLLPERDGELHAFDLQARQVLWSYNLESSLWASPITWQHYVYAVSWSNELHCLSLRTGDDIWHFALPSHVTATPIIAAGLLYVVTEDGELLIFEAESGKLLWQKRLLHSAIQASPLMLDDRLIIAALDGSIQAYRHQPKTQADQTGTVS